MILLSALPAGDLLKQHWRSGLAIGRRLRLRWLAFWRKLYSERLIAALESIALPSLVLWLGWQIAPHDPLGVRAAFPWSWLGPWLVAVRYGTSYGLVGVLQYALFFRLVPASGFPVEFFLGGTLMTLVFGGFGATYRRLEIRYREQVEDIRARLERAKRKLFILRESLLTLEQELVERPLTLRDAVLELRRLLVAQASVSPKGEIALLGPDSLLQLLSQACRITEAGIFHHCLGWRLVAKIGKEVPKFTPSDALIERVLETKKMVYVAQIDKASPPCPWVVALPLQLDQEGEVKAVLAVHSMPFMAFEEQNLRRLEVLCAAYLDFCQLEREVEEIRSLWPQAPIGLQHEWAQLVRFWKRFRLASYCAVWFFHPTIDEEKLSDFIASQPPESSTWRFRQGDGKHALVVSLPLMTRRALTNYVREMTGVVAELVGRPVKQHCHLEQIQISCALDFRKLKELLNAS